jgi:hypothetical protein
MDFLNKTTLRVGSKSCQQILDTDALIHYVNTNLSQNTLNFISYTGSHAYTEI